MTGSTSSVATLRRTPFASPRATTDGLPVLSTRLPDLKAAACRAFGMSHGALFAAAISKDRGRAWPRQVFCYVAVRRFGFSLAAVGRSIGRDHTTVMHGVAAVERRVRDRDPFTRALLARFLWRLHRGLPVPEWPSGDVGLAVPEHVAAALRPMAAMRGVPVAVLAARILEAVADDDLVDAVLDDRGR